MKDYVMKKAYQIHRRLCLGTIWNVQRWNRQEFQAGWTISNRMIVRDNHRKVPPPNILNIVTPRLVLQWKPVMKKEIWQPSWHTTSFQCPSDVHDVHSTLDERWNNVVCQLEMLRWKFLSSTRSYHTDTGVTIGATHFSKTWICKSMGSKVIG